MPDGDWRFVAWFISTVRTLGIEDWVVMDNGDKLFKFLGCAAAAVLLAIVGVVAAIAFFVGKAW